MNKRQVIILWVIAAVLGVAVTAVKLSQNTSAASATERAPGETLFASFPAADTASVVIEGADGTVNLEKKDGKWVVAQRGGYPANSTAVNDLIRTIDELEVTQGMKAGPSFAPRFGMDDSATKPEDHGLTATFKNAAGEEIAKVSLGKTIESGSSPNPMMGGGAVGRYVRNHADESGFYAVNEMFPSVSADPKRWLADGFINPEKIQSIAVAEAGKSESLWKVTRPTEEAEFKLEGAQGAEVLDTTAATPLKSIFSYARFEDVIPTDQVAAKAAEEGKRVATIQTFEGFNYTVTLVPAKPAAAPAENAAPEGEPPAADNYLVTVDVAAELPAERKKEDGEKPEDAKTKDTAFEERKKSLTEKLAKEKAYAGVTFEVSKSLVEPLLKSRAELITQATPPAEQAGNGGVQQLPGGMIATPPATATTPPISATTPPVSATTPPVRATAPRVQAVTPPIAIPPMEEEEEPDMVEANDDDGDYEDYDDEGEDDMEEDEFDYIDGEDPDAE